MSHAPCLFLPQIAHRSTEADLGNSWLVVSLISIWSLAVHIVGLCRSTGVTRDDRRCLLVVQSSWAVACASRSKWLTNGGYGLGRVDKIPGFASKDTAHIITWLLTILAVLCESLGGGRRVSFSRLAKRLPHPGQISNSVCRDLPEIFRSSLGIFDDS